MSLKITPAQALSGNITVPGDKSISHRAVMFAAMAEGESHISGWLPAADCWATVRAMRALGAKVNIISQSKTQAELTVRGVGSAGFQSPEEAIDCYGSGTTMRLLAGLVAGYPIQVTLDGHEGLRRRPMERIAKPLRQMGAEVRTTEGKPPMHIKGGNLKGMDYTLPVASAQVKSAVLLAGLHAEGQTIVREPGPARDHTERMLRAQKVDLQIDGPLIHLVPVTQAPPSFNIAVPADFSSAAFFMVAGLLVPDSKLCLEKVNTNLTRTGLLDVLQKMGANIELKNEDTVAGEPIADICVGYSSLRAIDIGGDVVVRMIDEFPILALAATQAQGDTLVRDAAELRVKETDRIAATVAELEKLGAKLTAHPDGFVVHGPTPLTGAEVDSHEDHRLAMMLSIAGLIAEGQTTVHNTHVSADSFPGFEQCLLNLGVNLEDA